MCAKFCSELSFYRAAFKLYDYFQKKGCRTVFPSFNENGIVSTGMYDPTLISSSHETTVKNDINLPQRSFALISGKNGGGKTSFLRATGINQLFAQNGLFVFASQYESPVYPAIVTHFQRGEDRNARFGKLAEELARLRAGYPKMARGAFVLFNDSFCSTTEKEGSEIARDVLSALSYTTASVLFVTPLYELLKEYKTLESRMPEDVKLISLTSSEAEKYKIIQNEPYAEPQNADEILRSLGIFTM